MKTVRIFAIALPVVFALVAQVHTVITTGKGLEPSEYPAYVSNLATYGYEEFGIKDNLVPAVKREWRNFRMTVTNNVNHYVEVASTARAGDTAGDIQPAVITNASGAVTRSLRPVMRPAVSSAPAISKRPMARPEGLAQKFAIQQALQEAQG